MLSQQAELLRVRWAADAMGKQKRADPFGSALNGWRQWLGVVRNNRPDPGSGARWVGQGNQRPGLSSMLEIARG